MNSEVIKIVVTDDKISRNTKFNTEKLEDKQEPKSSVKEGSFFM